VRRAEVEPDTECNFMLLRERHASVFRTDRPRLNAQPAHRRAASVGAQSVGAGAIGSLALAAVAIGALAIGALAIGRLAIGRARVGRLEIDELVVRRLRVIEQLQTPRNRDGED